MVSKKHKRVKIKIKYEKVGIQIKKKLNKSTLKLEMKWTKN